MNTAAEISTSQLANAIRALSMDAVQQANSGHPGAPMGMAEMAVALWTRHLQYNPANPDWFDRDRFVLSNGHASMLLYSVLHLTGYDLPIEEIKNFRQLHSKTPGHPELGITPGVETTTGPLGQGISNAVGMALAEKLLAWEFNTDEHKIVDHFTFAFTGDGCLMEGVSHEACSLAGTLKLNKLIALYDSNGISIDGEIKHWFAEDVAARYKAYGWQVIEDVDGHDVEAIDAAIAKAKEFASNPDNGPTMIVCKTHIGQGSPNRVDTAKAHGAPLGDEEIGLTRKAIGWSEEPFVIPADIKQAWDHTEAGKKAEEDWQQTWQAYQSAQPEKAKEFERRMKGDLPVNIEEKVEKVVAGVIDKAETVASRKSSQAVITEMQELLPEFLGGSADLTGSNFTDWKDVKPLRPDSFGRHINYGVREFGMSAIMNGISLHGGYIPFGGTFLTFSDYARNAVRMAALMKQRVVFVYSHDSIGVGEDGPTHQPIEHASSLRLIPNLDVWRPADSVETAIAWKEAISRPQSHGMHVNDGGPTALLTSRQALDFVERDDTSIAEIERGGYIISDAENPQAQIIATGSEMSIALKAQEQLKQEGISVRVVSMPCTNVFDRQDQAWKDKILPADLPSLAIEAGGTSLWYKYVGRNGDVLGLDSFGESAPAKDLFKFFKLTPEEAVSRVKKLINK